MSVQNSLKRFLKKHKDSIGPCQERMLHAWSKTDDLDVENSVFLLCNDFKCAECKLYKAYIKFACPFCEALTTFTGVVPKNFITLCRVRKCITCRSNVRIVYCEDICNWCSDKARCLFNPVAKPVVDFQSKFL